MLHFLWIANTYYTASIGSKWAYFTILELEQELNRKQLEKHEKGMQIIS